MTVAVFLSVYPYMQLIFQGNLCVFQVVNMKQLITLLLALLSTASSYMVQENAPYVYETKWYNQTVSREK